MLPSDKDKAYLCDISEACKDILEERIWLTATDHIENLLNSVSKYI